jgi:MraZ protein
MFIGRYYHTIEDQGRVSLPKKFRDTSDKWIITRGLDGGLFLFLNKTFEQELQKIAEHTFTKKMDRDFIRLMTNEAQEVEVDGNGRILLPDYLRATAQLTKNVVIIGSYQRIEIWDVDKYHQYLEYIEQHAEDIAEKVTTS